MKRKRIRKAYILVNTIGMAGYLLLVTAWALFAAVVVVLFTQTSSLASPTVISNGQPVANETFIDSQAMIYMIMIIVAAASFVALVTLSYFVARWCSRFLRHILKIMHIKTSKRSLFFTKCIAAALPLLGFALIALMTDPTDMAIPVVHIATIIASILGMGCFLLQIYIARSLSLSITDIW